MQGKISHKIKVSSKQSEIKVFEAFAGIGAQHKAIKNIKSDVLKVWGTSEWDARAIIAYAQIHHQIKFKKELMRIGNWSEEQLNNYLLDKSFSLNSKSSSRKITSKPLVFKQNLVAANKVNNNFPDITKINAKDIVDIDLITYSFPCQGLSIASMGRDLGIKENVDSRSNLIWQIKRILDDYIAKKYVLPKYLLMENVKNLLSQKHKPDFDVWLSYLQKIGYSTNWIVLNGLEHRSLQIRERVFAISVFGGPSISAKNFKDIFIDGNFSQKIPLKQRKHRYEKILTSSNGHTDEIADSMLKDTPSRIKMASLSHDLCNRKWSPGYEYTFNTLTTKQDRYPNIGMIDVETPVKGKLKKRLITPREAYLIMGFENKDFDNVKAKYLQGILTRESLYRQAGNSIVVSVLEDIFKYIESIEVKQNE